MKKLLLASTLIFLVQNCFSQVLGSPIASWDFADGIPSGWESGVISPNNVAHWEYRGPATSPDINVGPRGSCKGTNTAINSLTRTNGFMIFDSNYWDNSGTPCGTFGVGLDPAPHNAWLITNSVDLSAYSTVMLTFQQQFKHYQAQTKVDVSVNGGEWTNVLTNSGNQSFNAEWASTNISSWAAGESDVRIRFSFIGTYYWWSIDDIALYSPNENDIKLNWVAYTSNPFGLGTPEYSNLQYGKYPTAMLPQLKIRASCSNIGSNPQTNVRLNARAIKNGILEMLNSTTPGISMTIGNSNIFEITPPYVPSEVGDYKIHYQILQDQQDQNPFDNIDSLTFSVSPYSYARDRGAMVNSYEPVPPYSAYSYEIGNLFQITAANKYCHSLQVAIAEGTLPGAQIRGKIYSESTDSLIAQTNIYTVNVADLNTVGQEKLVTLTFPTPVALSNNTFYFVAVGPTDVSQQVRIARSGTSPSETSFAIFRAVNATFYSLTTPIVRMSIFNQGVKSGCKDSTAMNYVSTATQDDGSCRYPGCTDEQATNYNPNANFDDGTCVVAGCMDPLADNYNPNATVDIGGCIFLGCTNELAENYDPQATDDDGSCIILGCMDENADNYNPIATEEDGSCIILGCMDAEADNYNPEATEDDGSCIFLGCTNELAENYNPQANQDDGSCIIFGCMDAEADNYNPEATEDDSSCIFLGCTNELAENYNPQANQDDGSCIILGCTDAEADNYNPEATEDDGTCILLGCTNELAENYNPQANQDDGSCIVLGCTDENADNYNPDATEDDGSCVYIEIEIQLSPVSGCAPLSVTISNNTEIYEASDCAFRVNGEVVESECVDSFEYTFVEAGEYEFKYTYQVGELVADTVISIVVFPSPEVPLISYTPSSFFVECENCGENTITWYHEGQIRIDSTQSTLNILYEDIYQNGDYSVVVTDSNACTSASSSIIVVQPYFVIDKVDGCSPHEIHIQNLTDPIGGFYLLEYGDGTTNGSFTTDDTHIYQSASEYIVSLTLVTQIGEGSYSSVVNVHSGIEPIVSHDEDNGLIICENCDLYESVLWNIDGEIFVGFGPFPDTGENYTIIGETEFGCESSTSLVLTSLEEMNVRESLLTVYPNPARDYLVLLLSDINNPVLVEVLDMTGQAVFQHSIISKQTQLDTSTWSSGIYLVKVSSGNKIITSRLIINH